MVSILRTLILSNYSYVLKGLLSIYNIISIFSAFPLLKLAVRRDRNMACYFSEVMDSS